MDSDLNSLTRILVGHLAPCLDGVFILPLVEAGCYMTGGLILFQFFMLAARSVLAGPINHYSTIFAAIALLFSASVLFITPKILSFLKYSYYYTLNDSGNILSYSMATINDLDDAIKSVLIHH